MDQVPRFRRKALIILLVSTLPITFLPGAVGALLTPVVDSDLDAATFREWDGEGEKETRGGHAPAWVVWTRQSTPGQPSGTPGNTGINYGYSRVPGWRHLRVGFLRPIPSGSVLVRGGGRLSVLKPEAIYPGDLNNDADWLPAERLAGDSATTAEVADHEYGVWTLPPDTRTRALRFSHFNSTNDPIYVGYLGAVRILSERIQNLAPQASILASSREDLASRVIDGRYSRGVWENGIAGAPALSGGPSVISELSPEWLILHWPSEVTLIGLATTGQEVAGSGFGRARIQRFLGAGSENPKEAPESSWETVLEIEPDPLRPQLNHGEFDAWDFPSAITTKALRLLVTEPADTAGVEPWKVELVRGGRRVWLEEALALSRLGDQPLASAVVPKPAAPNPPIPIEFTLPKASVVTLVIEDAAGRRVRNLVSETPFLAGQHTVWWDGLDDQANFAFGSDQRLLLDERSLSSLPGSHGVNRVRPRLVEPGVYFVRGLARDPVNLAYEFSVNSPGDPPWTTFDRNGQPYRYFLNLDRYLVPEMNGVIDRSFGWLSDHTPPSDALFLPGDPPRILLASYVAEAGNALAWVDLDGRKRLGQRVIGGFWGPAGFVESGDWTGASCLARDDGTARSPEVEAYAASAFGQELRIHRIGREGTLSRVLSYPLENATEGSLGGLAVRNQRLVASLRTRNQLLWIGTADGSVLGTVPLEDPRGLAFDASGRLLAISGSTLLRFSLTPAVLPLPDPEVIATDLDDARRLAIDASGDIFLSLQGTSHQVRVLTPEGAFARTIGLAGRPRAGSYIPEKMQHPLGLTLAADNLLWVAENDHAPKRVSVWTKEGTFVRAFYGGPQYGGGGELDPEDRTRFYYFDRGGMEFRIDWDTGISRLVNIYHRAEPHDLRLPPEGLAWHRGPQTSIHLNGHHYMVADSDDPVGGARGMGIWRMVDGRTRPVAAISVVRTFADQLIFWAALTNSPLASQLPEPPAMVAWSDLDDDAALDAEELQFSREAPGSLSINARLEISSSNYRLYRPVRFSPSGVPVYDLGAAGTLMSNPPDDARYTAEETVHTPEGWTIKAANGAVRGVRQGILQWTYPNEWAGLPAVVGHPAPLPTRPGEVLGTMRTIGLPFVPSSGDAGEVFGVFGYFGNVYLFTADGLFLATLFQDERMAPGWMMPSLPRGASVNDISLHDEAFWPSLVKSSDGRIYLTVGKNHSSVVRVDGLETVRRIRLPELLVTSNHLADAVGYLEARERTRQKQQGRAMLTVNSVALPPVINGDLGDWQDADWVGLGASAKAAVRLAEGRLLVAFQVPNPDAVRNTDEPESLLFASGGGLEICVGAADESDLARVDPVEGDLRVFVTEHHGVPKTLVYQRGPRDGGPLRELGSSWRTIRLERIQDISEQVRFGHHESGYEIGIPLAALGWQPKAGKRYLGELGIHHGRSGQPALKAYWNNQLPSVHFDVAGEAALTPGLWGLWMISDSYAPPVTAENLPPALPVLPDLVTREGHPISVRPWIRSGLWHQVIGSIWKIADLPQDVGSLTNHPSFLNYSGGAGVLSHGFLAPGVSGPVTRYNHAQRVWGWIEPPLDGDYVFWISSGGDPAGGSQSMLYLSPDDRPENKRPIASCRYSPPEAWRADPAQESAPIPLRAGHRYYVEALFNEQFGPAHLGVGWRLPDETIERPIPARHFRLDPDGLNHVDLDWPPQSLSYTLGPDAPAGARIDPTTGVITWTPDEAQGGQSFPFTVRVTDDGFPAASAERRFTVVVAEVNLPPSITPLDDWSVFEGARLGFAAGFADGDLPPQAITWSLAPGAPAGAAINPTSGAFTWTPSEAQGPGVYGITLRATDNGAPPQMAERRMTVSVAETNAVPKLAAVGHVMAQEEQEVSWIARATDSDVPPQGMTFSLGPGAPAGAILDPVTGSFRWTPAEADGPRSHLITVQVTDDGVPPLTAEQVITISVSESNTAPTWPALHGLEVEELGLLSFTFGAHDRDLPAQSLHYLLPSGAPVGVQLDPLTGTLSWTPSVGQAGSYPLHLRVADDGQPVLSAETVVKITVLPRVLPRISIGLDGATLVLRWNAVAGARYRLQGTSRLGDGDWTDHSGEIVASGHEAQAEVVLDRGVGERFLRIVRLP